MRTKETDYSILAEIAEPMRLRILFVISSHGEICAADILPELGITQPTLSHHMSVLVDCGAVNVRKDGRRSLYSINEKMIILIESLANALRSGEQAKTIPVAAKRRAARSLPKRERPVKAADNEVSTIAEEKKKKKKDKDKKKKDKDKKKKK